LAGDLSPAPATYPEVVTERAAPPPLFGLAPHGVCPASTHYCCRGALLPHLFTLTHRESPAGGIVFCGTFRETRFERAPPAVSRHVALWRPDFPPASASFPAVAGDCPSGRPTSIIRRAGLKCNKLLKHSTQVAYLQSVGVFCNNGSRAADPDRADAVSPLNRRS
jgi:hypothetical protein